MKVPIEADWKSPCTVLVAREDASTVPASCLVGMLSGIRSMKLVSTRLNAVVCEFAMLPEMFSSAKDCARNPVTAVVRAPKIPMTDLQLRSGRPSGAVATRLWPHDRNGHRKPRAREIIMLFQSFVGGWPGAARVSSGADLPRAGKNCRVRSSNQAWKSDRVEFPGQNRLRPVR